MAAGIMKLMAMGAAALACLAMFDTTARAGEFESKGESAEGVPPEVVASAFDPYDDSIWTTTNARLLLHFNRDGELVHALPLPLRAVAMAMHLDESVWIVGERELMHVARSGALLATFPLALVEAERATALAVDALRDRLWLATTNGLAILPIDSPLTMTRVGDGATVAVAVDPRSGEVAAITDDALVVINGSAVRRVDVPYLADEHVIGLTFDPQLGAFAIVTNRGGLHLQASSMQVERAAPEGAPSDVARFRLDPTITLVRPPSGGVVTSRTDAIVVLGGARCNDSPCDVPDYVSRMTIGATLGGRTLADRPTDDQGVVQWPLPPVASGRSEFTAYAVDRFGHAAVLTGEHVTALEATGRTITDDPTTTSAAPTTGKAIADDPTSPAPTIAVKAANKPPTVALTTPASGSSFTVGSSISLAADASDPDGSIVKVEFYRGGTTLLATATASPYRATWSPATAGSYSLTAKAYDNRNGSATSSSVSITVANNQPPSVALGSPAPGAFVPVGSTITLLANASDPDGTVTSVEFLDGSTSLGSARMAPFQIAWTPAVAGVHSIKARATDDKGAVGDSVPVDVVVGQPPVVVVTSPVACSSLDGPIDVMLSAHAMSIAGTIARVDFFDNGAYVGSSYAAPWNVVLASAQRGVHSITANAVDDHGFGTSSRAASFTVRAPNLAPTVALTSPAEGSHVSIGATVNLAANASDADGTVVAVEFRHASAVGPLIARTTSAPYTASWTASGAGSYSFVAVAFDDRNASTTSAPVHVNVDQNQAPTVTLTSPSPNARYVAPANVSLAANASDVDGTVAKVEFFAGTTLIGSTMTAPFGATWTGAAAGSYSLTAKATDNAGATTSSPAVPIVVASNEPPTATLTLPSAGPFFAPATIPLSASASDSDGTIARIEFYANGALIGTASAPPYNFVWDGVAAGSYAITAKAFDDGGASTASVPVNISVQATATIAFDGDLPGATVNDDKVLVRGFVSAPANSAVTVNGAVTHIDDRGWFQANDVPLAPGANEIVAVVTSQDGQTTTKSVTIESSGPGLFVVNAAPTEGLETLQVTFTLENPQNRPFKLASLDIDSDGNPDLLAYPEQFDDGTLSITVTYPAGTWLATIRFFDDQDRVIYEARKSIVVLLPQLFQANVRAIYENMLMRLRAGNIQGALTAFTGSAYDKYNGIFAELQGSLAETIDQLGTVTEITFNLDMAELTLMRDSAEGAQKFMLYLIRSEDGIWRIDGM